MNALPHRQQQRLNSPLTTVRLLSPFQKLCGFRWLCVGMLVSLAGADQQALKMSPTELVRQVVQNELRQSTSPGKHFLFKDAKTTTHLSQLRLIVETCDATAGMTVEQNGQRLSPEQMQAENARLENYVKHPEELNRKQRQEKEDAERMSRILRAMPDAFLYQYDGMQQGTAGVGKPGDELVRLKFRPNPNYNPPSHVEQVLTGMAGVLLIDASQNRIAEINVTL